MACHAFNAAFQVVSGQKMLAGWTDEGSALGHGNRMPDLAAKSKETEPGNHHIRKLAALVPGGSISMSSDHNKHQSFDRHHLFTTKWRVKIPRLAIQKP